MDNQMILAYNWLISDTMPQNQQQISAFLKVPQPNQELISVAQQQSNSIHPVVIHVPYFVILFAYYVQQSSTDNTQVQLQPRLLVEDNPLPLSTGPILRFKNYICMGVKLSQNDIYDQLLVLKVDIRFHAMRQTQTITNMNQLVRLAGMRKLSPYTQQTYRTLHQEIVLQSPVILDLVCRPGCLIVKLIRTQQAPQKIVVKNVQVMNWLSNKPNIAKQNIRSVLDQSFQLKGRDMYALGFEMVVPEEGAQLFLQVFWMVEGNQQSYRMVKTCRAEWQDNKDKL